MTYHGWLNGEWNVSNCRVRQIKEAVCLKKRLLLPARPHTHTHTSVMWRVSDDSRHFRHYVTVAASSLISVTAPPPSWPPRAGARRRRGDCGTSAVSSSESSGTDVTFSRRLVRLPRESPFLSLILNWTKLFDVPLLFKVFLPNEQSGIRGVLVWSCFFLCDKQ